MKFLQKLSYGFGHFYNDLCSALWFSYLVLFQTRVFHLNELQSGILILIGQISDAIATPVIGYYCDRVKIKFYSKRKLWHLIGTFLVTLSFPLLFYNFFPKTNGIPQFLMNKIALSSFIFYIPFITLFQIGWAIVQIAHLSLIPDLSSIQTDRIDLNAIRYFFTIMANIVLYSIIWYVFNQNTSTIDENDSNLIMYTSLGITSLGSLFSFLFHLFLKENKQNDETNDILEEINTQIEEVTSENNYIPLKSTVWFKIPKFYMITLMYGTSRLLVNSTQVYFVLQLVYSMNISKSAIAYFPLILYVFSLIGTILIKPLVHFFNISTSFIIGCILCISTGFWYMYVVQMKTNNLLYQLSSIFVACMLLGLSGTLLVVCTLYFATNLIGNNTNSGAYIYGFMSLFDKLINGIVILIIQALTSGNQQNISLFYNQIMVFTPITVGFFLLILLFINRCFFESNLELNHDQ